MPDCSITQGSKRFRGKGSVFGLQLLEANDVWLSFGEPSREILQPLVDVVDVERYDLQRSGPARKAILTYWHLA